jgi:hypothetical protein
MVFPKLLVGSAAGGVPPGFPADPPPLQTWLTPDGETVARGFRHRGDGWMLWPRLAAYRFNFPDEQSITAYPEPGARLSSVWDVYRRSVLPMAMQAAGWEVLHASGIVAAGGVVAFCARSETGKSTVAYGLSRRGFPQWADDGVVVGVHGGIVAMPLPFEVRLREGSERLLRGVLPEHSRFEFNGPGAQVHASPLPIRALCVLERVSDLDAVARIAPIASADAFTALLTHAHEFDWSDANRRAAMVQTYLRVVADVPMFAVSFAPSPEKVEELFDAIIAALHLELPRSTAVVS